MRIRRLLAITLALAQGLGLAAAWANPVNGSVVSGQATFNNNGNVLTIVNTPGAIINWQGFSIGPDEITRFLQQGASSAVLNRIVGQDPSVILGALQSNGHVFLVNPNGIVFGAGARVDVNGLVASSLDIANDDFQAGRLRFAANGANAGGVRNDGTITTPGGGRVYLIAPDVENNGLIASPQGDVVLAAGRQVELVDSANPDLRVVASAPTDRALNLGRILAQGGSIGIYGALIEQRGVIDADSAVAGEDGRIVFKASGTTLLEDGSVTTARGAGTGGSVEVLGDHVGLTGDATIDASGTDGGGTVLVGGDYHGANAAIQNASATYIGSGTSIRADATDSGNGGRVIVWSNGATRAYGNISARGGANSGDGGFAEVSGAGYLDYEARADLRAANGTAGTLLLDPSDIVIQATGPTTAIAVPSSSPPTFAGGPSTSILTTSDLEGQLALGNVTVTTTAVSDSPPGSQGGHITVASPVSWNGSALTLDADNGISIDAAITAGGDSRLFLVSRGGPITQTAPIATTYLGISSVGNVDLTGATNMVSVLAAQVGDATHLDNDFTFVNGQSFAVGSVNGINGISIQTSANPGGGGMISLHATSGDITQLSGDALSANAANIEADNVVMNESNSVSFLSGALGGGSTFSFTAGGNLTVASVGNRNGIQAGNGDVTLVSLDGNLALSSFVSTGGGAVSLTAPGSITGNASGLVVAANAGNGISLATQASSISATNGGGANGINIANTGTLSVGTVTDNGTGPISIATSAGSLGVNGPVTSNGGGAITLAAGPTGNGSEDLVVVGSIATAPGAGVAVATSGPVLLRAGEGITVTGTIAGNVTQQPNLNPPSISQCVADPTAAGCAQVLPTLASCIANPSLTGCSAVLPSLASCIATPTLSGCQVVLPTLASCIANPSLAGCQALLPSLASCIATPSLAGCQGVLPTLASCIATPTQAGCQAVLPTLASCIATPSQAGCQGVLPTLASCIATPSQSGCQAVLPTLVSCIAAPSQSGCQAVLPTLDQCVANPALAGCGVVLPTAGQCTTTPTLAGCSHGSTTGSGAEATDPIAQASNHVVGLVNTSVDQVTTHTDSTDKPGTPNTQTNGNLNQSGAKNDDGTKKMYCN